MCPGIFLSIILIWQVMKVMGETPSAICIDRSFNMWVYHPDGSLRWMTYPGGNNSEIGEKVSFEYLPQKALLSVLSSTNSYYYLQKATYDEAGRVDMRSLGAASLAVDPLLKTNLDYYPWNQQGGRLKTLQSGIPSNITSLQSFEYDYVAGDENRLQLMAEDKDHLQLKAGGTQTQTFHYDDIDRLEDAVASGGTGGTYPTEAYDYNETTGNLATKAGVTYTYGNSNHPHAVTSLSNGNTYSYDANGNQLTKFVPGVGTQTRIFDAENRLVGVSGSATASFVYDGDGQRVKGTAGGTTTVNIGASFEWSGSTSTMKRYYYSGSVRIAVRVGNGSGTAGLSWLLGDHLGSTSLTVDMSAARTGELRYKPYGETRFSYGITPTTYKFTGQREQVEIGLYYFQARWLDASLGRFISADTIIPEPGSPLSWDRYLYTRGNPLKYIDPSGHDICLDGENFCYNQQNRSWKGIKSYRNQPIKPYFYRSPVSRGDLKGVQWFGATQNAYDLWKYGDDTYDYCQYLHCGLDFLADYGSPISAGVYGIVIYANSIPNNNPAQYEGPWKVMIQVGSYVITYGHTDGYPLVRRDDYVNPDTIISGVGNMAGRKGSNAFSHLHLEVRGPGGWNGGDSINPLFLMSSQAKDVIVDAARMQTIETRMSRFYDGTTSYGYPPPRSLMTYSIHRTNSISFWE
jgi:RHS repeat-associated protein